MLTLNQTIAIISCIGILLIIFIIVAIKYVFWLDKKDDILLKTPKLNPEADDNLEQEFWGTLKKAEIFS